MILSALLTSVGINFGLCLLFFTLYSILRKQSGNISVYAPRLVARRKSEKETQFNLERLLPSTGWVKKAWHTSEEDLLENSGLDAVVLMRVFTFSLKVFTAGGILGVFILLPFNYLGSQLVIDFHDLPGKPLDSFSISNVNDGSSRLWIHFCGVYIFTGLVCYLLYHEYYVISSKRVMYFHSSKPQPHHFTVLVRGVPASDGNSFSENVEQFFREYHPSTYLSHSVIRRTSKLQKLVKDGENLYKTLAGSESKNGRNHRSSCCSFWPLLKRRSDHLEKKLNDVEVNMRMERSSSAGKEVPAAFVSFKSRLGAAIALHIQQGVNPTQWVTEAAPEPQEVYWPFFSASFLRRWISKVVVFVTCVALTILFLIPVFIVQGLTHLEQLEHWFPFLRDILALTFVSQVITGYLPSLILQTFLSFIPPIMKMLSAVQGYVSLSEIERSACKKVLWFTLWNIFFANVLSGSALNQVNIFLEPKKVPRILAQGVPVQASFFISYVVTSGWTSLSSELFRLFPLLCSHLKKKFHCKDNDEEFEVRSFPYESEIPRILFFELLGITYFFLAPLILPFLLVYFGMGYLVFRNQLLNVYENKYETGGKFWPIVHNSTIVSLILMQIIAIGMFGLKDLALASSLTIPLPILTLLFNEYCRKRFLPVFSAYSLESLIKKDREDEKDPTFYDFRSKLVTAYEDPALRLVQYSRDGDWATAPLLRPGGV